MDIDKVCTHAFRLLLILLRFLISASKHKHVFVTPLRLLGVSVYYSGHLLIQDAVVDVSLFGVEILVERRPDDTVVVDGYSVLLGQLVEVGRIPILLSKLLPVASLVSQNHQLTP